MQRVSATIRLDVDHSPGDIDPRIFSGFLEHLGRAVYGGSYDPGNPLSDADGGALGTPLFQVDAFTDRPFRGNPAAVTVLRGELAE